MTSERVQQRLDVFRSAIIRAWGANFLSHPDYQAAAKEVASGTSPYTALAKRGVRIGA